MENRKTTSRSSFSSVSRHRDSNQNTLYIAQYTPIIVYHAQFYKQYLLICSNTIRIYNIEDLELESQVKVQTHWASFVPFTDYLCFPDGTKQERPYLVFWNFRKEEQMAKITFNFSIEEIRCSRGAITVSSLEHLYTLHFPSLKPIYENFSGNGIKVVFDASREGLTLAHNTNKKGELVVNNFTNIQTNKLLNELQSHSRLKSFSKIFKGNTGKQTEDRNEIKKQLTIKAHTQNVILIRLSPNGYRVVTASIKGTIIRMHSCLKGELISQFRVAYHVSRIVDLKFIEEGNQIVCLNNQNQVCLFHTRMSDLELLSQSSRKGYEIYQQQNPTSFFSFLSFLNQNFSNEHPFAYFQLDVNKDDVEDLKIKLQSEKEEKMKIKINQIPEVQESHHEDSNSDEGKKEDKKKQKKEDKKEQKKEEQKEKEESKENEDDSSEKKEKQKKEELKHHEQIKIQQFSPEEEENKKESQNLFNNLGIFKKHSLTNHAYFKSLKVPSHSVKHKATGSSSSAGKNSKRNAEFKTFGEKEKKMFFKGIINFGSDTNLKVFQGKYIFQLKFDPFNGGRMVEKKRINLLKDEMFSDLW